MLERLGAVAVLLPLLGCGWVTDQIMKKNPAAAFALGAGKAAASKAPIGVHEELAYGGAVAIKIVQKYGGLVEDPTLVHYVGLVGNAVAAFSDRPNLRYHFGILKSRGVNAVSAPGGYVFITMGALRKMKSEAQLAGVLAHEVGHITRRHALEIIKNLKAKAAMVSAAASTMDNADFFKDVVNSFLNDFLERGLPKETEFEADLVGTRILMTCGYSPAGLRDFLAGMIVGKSGSESAHKDPFYDTHPDTGERVARLDAMIRKAGSPGGRKLVERLARNVPMSAAVAHTRPAASAPAAGVEAAPARPSRPPRRPGK